MVKGGKRSSRRPVQPPAEDEEADGDDVAVFVIRRELSEVHLLLDNLSANPDQSLTPKGVEAFGLPSDWVKRVCAINWPPPRSLKAEQAALLIHAKDYLNTRARPASGATIAFTLLVAQEDNARRRLVLPDWGQQHARRETKKSEDEQLTMYSLATTAYPGLIKNAKDFRWFMGGGGYGLLFFLILTCGVSSYAAFGNLLLAQRQGLQAAADAARIRVDDAETRAPDSERQTPLQTPAPVQAAGQVSGQSSGQVAGQAGPVVVAPGLHVRLCDQDKLLPPLIVGGTTVPQYKDLRDTQLCDQKARADYDVKVSDHRLWAWNNPMRFLRKKGAGKKDPARENTDGVNLRTGSRVTLLGTSILPVMYGILGASAAVVRSLSRKMRDSLLAPRDLLLSLQQLMLGALMGACIGLFVAQPSAGAQNNPGLIGAVALSSSALSFVAGFGVDNVFAAIEGLIRRIFPAGQSVNGGGKMERKPEGS